MSAGYWNTINNFGHLYFYRYLWHFAGSVPFGRGEEGGVISLGLPCSADRQCRSADPSSRCINGVCDCAIKTNSSNGNSCSATNRGCHPGTFQVSIN